MQLSVGEYQPVASNVSRTNVAVNPGTVLPYFLFARDGVILAHLSQGLLVCLLYTYM